MTQTFVSTRDPHTWRGLPNKIRAPTRWKARGRTNPLFHFVAFVSFSRYGRARKKTANQPCQQQPSVKHFREQAVRSPALWSWSGGVYGRVHTSYHNDKLPVSFRFLGASGLLSHLSYVDLAWWFIRGHAYIKISPCSVGTAACNCPRIKFPPFLIYHVFASLWRHIYSTICITAIPYSFCLYYIDLLPHLFN